MTDASDSTAGAPDSDSKAAEGVQASTRTFTLSHWSRRALARILDYLVLAAIGIVVGLACSAFGIQFFDTTAVQIADGRTIDVPTGGTGFTIYTIFGLIYSAAMVVWTGTSGRTVGKKLVGIKVLREQDANVLGVPYAFLRAVVKTIVAVVSVLLVPLTAVFWIINYGFAIFDAKRQPVTDKLLRVVAIDTPKVTSKSA